MARPKRCNADYFSHDVHMRNDIKIKAVRKKYGHVGYSVWIMLLEHLANCDYFEYEWNELNIELLTPDFDVESEQLCEMIDYFRKLDLIQLTNGFIHCEHLTERLMEYLGKNREGFHMENSKRVKENHSLPEGNSYKLAENNDTKEKKTKLNQSEETKLNETKVKFSKENKTEQNFDDIIAAGLATI